MGLLATSCRLQRRPKAVSEFTPQADIGLIGRSQPFAEVASLRKQTNSTLGKRTLNVRVLPRHLRSVGNLKASADTALLRHSALKYGVKNRYLSSSAS